MEFNNIWINKDIFDWQNIGSLSYMVGRDKWIRAYNIWEHSRKLIEKNDNEFDLTDGITNLKRCLNHRLKLIEEIYELKSINIDNKPKGYLDLLERFGIVRPLIMKKLLFIRNDIEHNDASPPSLEKCLELLDVIWYFLKSTDSIAQNAKCGAEFELIGESGSKTSYGYTLEIDFENKGQSRITGWFPYDYISEDFRENFFEVSVESLKRKDELCESLIEEHHQDKLDSDTYLIGSPTFESNEQLVIVPKVLYSL